MNPTLPLLTTLLLGSACLVAACSAGSDANETQTTSGAGAMSAGGSHAGGTGTGGLSLGGQGGTTPPGPVCKVTDSNPDALPPCQEQAPPNSFQPEIQWTWTAPTNASGYSGVIVTPLVGNFTDDNGDGDVDLCDIPDVIVTSLDSIPAPPGTGTITMLNGANGTVEATFQAPVDPSIAPAFADIDHDGLPEVVAATPDYHLRAFAHDGSVKWTNATVGGWTANINSYCTAIELYDLEGDGNVEIIIAFEVYDSQGNLKWGIPGNGAQYPGGDGKLEVLFGHGAYRANGTLYWEVPGINPGHPHVADFDGDGEPEVLWTTDAGITVVEADGTLKFGPVRPTDPGISSRCWGKPGVVHDFDGDGHPEFATGSCSDYSMYKIGATATPVWSAGVSDQSGLATGTAFDFLGDGTADAIYADELTAYVFDGATGASEMTTPRTSGTLIEYPIVVDVDNDGSAEFIVPSNYGAIGDPSGPGITVWRDAQDRWIQARRIWNQHAYHVTNVREDGVIPQVMPKNWKLLNTFRTNSQIGDTGDCVPPPPN